MSKSAKNSNFISIPDLERHSVVDVKAANGVVCVLTDLGEVYMFDDCLDLIKAPVYQDTVIGSISTTDNVIYGIDKHKNQIFEWKYNRKIRLSASYESENCQLTY